MSFSRSLIAAVTSLLFLAACTKTASNPAPRQQQGPPVRSENVVSLVTSPVAIPAGGSADASIQLKIQEGYHINANPPTYPYLKATELEMPPAAGVSVAFITYPDALSKQFPFAEKPVSVYEGSVPIKIVLKAAGSAQKGSSNLPGKLKVQACDDQVCYPPGEVSVTIPVTVK